MLITIENKFGKTLSEIADTKRKFIASYARINKEIFGSQINEQLTLENASCGVSNMENHFLSKLNKSLEAKGSNVRLTSLHKNLKVQISEYFINSLVQSLEEVIQDSAKFLCSQTGMSEEKISDYLLSELMEELTKEMGPDKIKSCKINELLKAEKEFEDILEIEVKKLIESIESQKPQSKKAPEKNKQNVSKEEKVEKENKSEQVKSSNNFVPKNNKVQEEQKPAADIQEVKKEDIIDVDYQNVSVLSNDDKKELKNKVADCNKFYTNKDRLTMMLGGNVNKAEEVLAKVLEKIDLMDQVITNDKSKEEISNVLSEMQIELIDMINAYNPAIKSTLNIMDLFKNVEVGSTGEPIRVEDFFGKFYEPEELVDDNNVIDNIVKKNLSILNKHNSQLLNDTLQKIQQQTGTLLKLEEVKAPYKEINPVIKATPIVKDSEVNRYFFIDIYGSLYLDSPKFIILNNSDALDEGYFIDINRTDIVIKYIFNSITQSDLESNDLINPRLRSLNDAIDISSIHKNNKQLMTDILLEQKSIELIRKAKTIDKSCRFRLEELAKNSFTMISDSRTKTYFNGQTCKRKKMRLLYDLNKKELILQENVK